VFRITSKIKWTLLWSTVSHSPKFHENPPKIFWVIETNRRTNRQTNDGKIVPQPQLAQVISQRLQVSHWTSKFQDKDGLASHRARAAAAVRLAIGRRVCHCCIITGSHVTQIMVHQLSGRCGRVFDRRRQRQCLLLSSYSDERSRWRRRCYDNGRWIQWPGGQQLLRAHLWSCDDLVDLLQPTLVPIIHSGIDYTRCIVLTPASTFDPEVLQMVVGRPENWILCQEIQTTLNPFCPEFQNGGQWPRDSTPGWLTDHF